MRHSTTIRVDQIHAACKAKGPRAPGYWVKVRRYLDNGKYELVDQWIPNVMSRKCRSDIDIQRVGPCRGCTQEQDFDYFRQQGLI